MSAFVGRAEPLARLTSAFRALTVAPARRAMRWPGLVLVIGEAGIGKTALLNRFATDVAVRGTTVVWGTCWDGEQAPAWWPWTQILRGVLEQSEDLRTAARPELAVIVPELAAAAEGPAASPDAAERVRVFDAAGQLLRAVVSQNPLLIILDDLQWADGSTVDLLRFLAHQTQPGALMLVGAYRPSEPRSKVSAGLADLATAAELVLLHGLSTAELADLVRAIAGPSAPAEWAELVQERTGGHPLFARELCRLLAAGGVATETPAAVRDVIVGRVARLSSGCRALLEAAAVAGSVLMTDVLSEVADERPTQVAQLISEATVAGILAPTADGTEAARFTHDLYRETLYAVLPPARRLELHYRVAMALLARHDRGGPVIAGELARHFSSAMSLAGIVPAMTWARAAADADATRFAFADAAGHLARVRSAAVDAGQSMHDDDLVDLLTAEAGLRLRSGDINAPRKLLDDAWTRAAASGGGELLGTVALGFDELGARFAMPRADLVAALDSARQALEGTAGVLEAQVTAALARQLQHSVPADRPRAAPLAERAVTIARGVDDAATLASCLLAQHDTRWTPGTTTERAAIAAEITDLARQANDPERQAQGLLLTANAQLEGGLASFRATLVAYQDITEALRQPRQDYLLRIRQAALALIDGNIDDADRLSAEAADLGDAIADSDTGNVRMSQRLEIVRARNQPAELRTTAADAVRWWVGRRLTLMRLRPDFSRAPATTTPPAGSSTRCCPWTGAATAHTCGRSSSAR